jgi:eukaryotic-like serine/threonine-protein kinase
MRGATPGQQFSHFEVIEKIGEGGMGEVYRARDTLLGRDVAIKLLPSAFVNDPERMARFSREAQFVASLNHPNIGAIYGIEQSSNTPVLILELVEGPTLADRIATGPMPLEEALAVAKQIAEALEYAHDKGVVHRDLKPANVKITPDGVVKVLDFGLAKATEEPATSRDPSVSPTLTIRQTQAGMILGTAAYMAPEQARGKSVDQRADIWAFGVVLYEMLTGRRLFGGETVSDMLAAVLTQDPEWHLIPSSVQRLLRRCLERDPKRRLRDIGDAWALLDDAPHAQAAPARWAWLPWSACAGFFVIAAAIAGIHFREISAAVQPLRFQIYPPEGVSLRGPVMVSPNGRMVVFAGTNRDGASMLWIRALDAIESRPLTGSEGVSTVATPIWSPDNRFIAFVAADKLKKIPVDGGSPQSICDVSGRFRGGFWTRDNRIILGSFTGGLTQVSSGGGPVMPVTGVTAAGEGASYDFPAPLPDGRHFVSVRRSRRDESGGIYVDSLDQPGAERSKKLLADQSRVVYVPSAYLKAGHLLFQRERALMAQPFDASRLELTGDPVPIIEQVGSVGSGPASSSDFSVSDNGVLVYRTGSATSRLTWFDRKGTVLSTVGEPGQYNMLALSRDGMRLAVQVRGPQSAGPYDLWLFDLTRGVGTRFTTARGDEAHPNWSPDGTRLIFSSNQRVVEKAANGGGPEQLLLDSAGTVMDWSRDGRFLLLRTRGDPRTKSDLWVVSLEGDRTPVPVVRTEFIEANGQFSPNGRWMAYRSDESGESEIYVQSFQPPGSGGKWLISQGGGYQPRWKADGKELFYFSSNGKLMAVDVSTVAADKNPVFRFGTPKVLFSAPIKGGGPTSEIHLWDVAPDGQRFLINSEINAAGSTPITVVVNWQAGLTQ